MLSSCTQVKDPRVSDQGPMKKDPVILRLFESLLSNVIMLVVIVWCIIVYAIEWIRHKLQ